MPNTPIYGLPFEQTPTDQPGITLHGGTSGTEEILAEAVETELARIDSDIADLPNIPMIRYFLTANTDHAAAEAVLGSMTVDFSYGTWSAPLHSSIRDIPIDGVYRVSAVVRSTIIDTSVRQLVVRKNVTSTDPTTGTNIATSAGNPPSDSTSVSTVITTVHPFSAGDNVTVSFVHTAGGNIGLSGGSANTFVIVEFVRPL